MLRLITSFSLVSIFSYLGYFCLQDSISAGDRSIPINYLKPEISENIKIYKVPVIKVDGEIIGDRDATQIAYQKGVGFIKENRGAGVKN